MYFFIEYKINVLILIFCLYCSILGCFFGVFFLVDEDIKGIEFIYGFLDF